MEASKGSHPSKVEEISQGRATHPTHKRGLLQAKGMVKGLARVKDLQKVQRGKPYFMGSAIIVMSKVTLKPDARSWGKVSKGTAIHAGNLDTHGIAVLSTRTERGKEGPT